MIDTLLGVAVTIVMMAVISANHGGDSDPDAVAHLWAVGLGSLMPARRRHPVAVLSISVLGLFAYYAAGYPAVGVAVPIAAALYSAAEFGRMGWAVGAGALTLGTSVFFRLAEGQEMSLVVGYELAGHVLLIAAVIAVGDGVRSRRKLMAGVREIVALTAERAERESEAKSQAERVAVARDLHDSVGHSTSVVSIHADVAREAIARGDTLAADEALRLVKNTAMAVMSDLRRTVAALRSSERPRRHTTSLADVRTVIDPGLDIRFTTDVRPPDDLSAAVESTAFRIVQEAVTNIVRHSTATEAHILAEDVDGTFHVAIIDNGRPKGAPGVAAGSGHGITGMRERVKALGGTLTAAPSNGDGFEVRARIPLEGPT